MWSPAGARVEPATTKITVFDSSGTALQDVAAAIVVYDKALASGRGTEVTLDD
jgi:ornithine cyclodeaminase/alanine dehydrogenase-like protein (mu-crystallin family)